MKRVSILLFLGLFTLVGCDESLHSPDYTPPAPPSNVRTETGDNFIELFWNANRESDVAGYNVFVSSSYDGRYELIGSATREYFVDYGARNGELYYYAITAFDFDGNESDLSRDVVYDVPRPEGYNVMLNDFRQSVNYSGYDFSDYAITPYNDQYADMYFENFNGVFYMNVRTDTDIQDMGPTGSILDIKVAPAAGWSPTHDAQLHLGHTYVVWTWDDHYAKFRVTGISPGRVVFDWAYQLQRSNPMLKRPVPADGLRHQQHEERKRE